MARTRQYPRRSSQRRKTSWDQGSASGGVGTEGAAQSINATGETLMGVGAASGSDGLTLIRTRGQALFYLTEATAANAGYQGAFGIGVVTTEAFDVGTTAIPGPLSEAGWDGWLYHTFLDVKAGGTIDGSAAADHDLVNPTTAAVRIWIDSKSMRKTDEGVVIFAAWEGNETGTAILRIQYNSRILAKLP